MALPKLMSLSPTLLRKTAIVTAFIGAMAMSGSGAVSQDYPPIETKPKKIAAASKACDAGDMVQCHVYAQSVLNLPYKKGGENYYDWKIRNAPQLIKAYAASEKACNNGIEYACHDAAIYWMANIYDINPKVPGDLKRGRALLARGCEGGNTYACTVLQRVDNPTRGATELLKLKITDNWKGTVYFNLFFAVDEGPEFLYLNAKAADFPNMHRLKSVLIATSCEMGYLGACWDAAISYYNANGYDNLAQDVPRAVEFAQKGCDGGDERSCHSLGFIYFKIDGGYSERSRTALIQSLPALEKLCDAGEGKYCNELAALNIENIGSNYFEPKAAYYNEQGCNAGYKASCDALWANGAQSKQYCDGLVSQWNAEAASTQAEYAALDARRAKTETANGANNLFAEMTSVKRKGCYALLAITKKGKYTCRAHYEDMLHTGRKIHTGFDNCAVQLREMDEEYHRTYG